MKRLFSMLLALVMLASIVPSAFAASDEVSEAAQSLYELGLFNGTGTDANGDPIFELDRTPTRYEAVTMLVRLLGKEEEAQNGTWDIPFTDVVDWARPYVGYAYANGLTTGTSATSYSGDHTVTASEYLTFVLRALGYSSGTDFQWNSAWELSDSLGITNGQYDADTTNFTRGDVAIISNDALSANIKGTDTPLLSTLNVSTPDSNRSSTETKIAIMEACVNGATTMRDAFRQTAENLSSLSSNSYYANHQLQIIGETLQENTRVAVDYFQNAVGLCGDYSDTQTVKRCLEELIEIYSGWAAYKITTDNALEYIGTYIPTDSERENVLLDQIEKQFDIWAGQDGTA